MTVDLGRTGIWSRELRYHPDPGARSAAAAELEELGYSAIFIPDVGGDVLGAAGQLLAATRRIPVATGILNIWLHDPAAVARGHADLTARFGPRFLLGLGSGHAQQALGPAAVLAPQQAAVLDPDRARGRERARDFVSGYLGLPAYVASLRRLGYTDDDLRGPASDRLVDALVAYGDEEAVAARVRAQHQAGADHVCVYVLGGGPDEALPLDAWRRLAPALAEA